MVLKHQVDEEFKYKQTAMRKSVIQTLRQILVQKHQMKSSKDLDKLHENIINGKTNIEHSIWNKIVK